MVIRKRRKSTKLQEMHPCLCRELGRVCKSENGKQIVEDTILVQGEPRIKQGHDVSKYGRKSTSEQSTQKTYNF